ncbi:MAG: ATP-binding protein [Cereibacter sphaeroides]|uniref:ATP-binding protein n=1 Tax=Cereibacter sphaeroides TaxID=1063 RepID=A0A2W5S1D0_CERSP|nr:MAG: ATP-binding protein [Cereibacter sphaeroides]
MPSDPEGRTVRLVLQGDPYSVRNALRQLFANERLRFLRQSDRNAAELVLAEVLNNVVEHAYAHASGEIEILVQVGHGSLVCTVVDHGVGMPNGRIPQSDTPPGCADLPEGGYGWPLIRDLSSDLSYRRIGDRNELSFRLKAEQ